MMAQLVETGKRLPMEKLEDGESQCQVSVLDATRKKAAFWQAGIMIVP